MARLFYPHIERRNMPDALNERKKLDEQLETTGRNPKGILIERPPTKPDTQPVNGNYNLPDEDEDEGDDDTEDDLILGNEEEVTGDEEEFDVELEEEMNEGEIDEDDLLIEADDEDDEDDDL